MLVLIWAAFGVSCVATSAWSWGAWMSSGRNRDEDGGGNMSGGVYVDCLREPVMRGGGGVLVAGGIGVGSWRRKWSVTEGVTGSLKLAMRRGKVVQVDADGKRV